MKGSVRVARQNSGDQLRAAYVPGRKFEAHCSALSAQLRLLEADHYI